MQLIYKHNSRGRNVGLMNSNLLGKYHLAQFIVVGGASIVRSGLSYTLDVCRNKLLYIVITSRGDVPSVISIDNMRSNIPACGSNS